MVNNYSECIKLSINDGIVMIPFLMLQDIPAVKERYELVERTYKGRVKQLKEKIKLEDIEDMIKNDNTGVFEKIIECCRDWNV